MHTQEWRQYRQDRDATTRGLGLATLRPST
jgi:hypothetical protein